MPFTPFYLGAGAGACGKAAVGDRFSFVVFGGSQVLMELEPGIKLLTGSYPLHGPSHTLAGALVIAGVATVLGKPIGEWVLRLVRFADWRISWRVSAASALFGTLSHILLDAVMHPDMRPWWPLTSDNGLLELVSLSTLHAICAGLAAVGVIGIWMRYRNADGR